MLIVIINQHVLQVLQVFMLQMYSMCHMNPMGKMLPPPPITYKKLKPPSTNRIKEIYPLQILPGPENKLFDQLSPAD